MGPDCSNLFADSFQAGQIEINLIEPKRAVLQNVSPELGLSQIVN